jgi:hypothetical protein
LDYFSGIIFTFQKIERDNIVILQLKEINGSAISKKKSINRGNRSYPNGILEGPLNVAINYHTDPHLNTIFFTYINVTNNFF